MTRASFIVVMTLLCNAALAQPVRPSLEDCNQAFRAGRYADARDGLAPLRRGRTRHAATLLLAQVHVETGRYEEAADLLRPLVRRRGAQIEAATLLGEVQAKLGRLDESQRTLESVVGEPGAHRARVLLARVLLRRGRTTAAQLPAMSLIEAYNDATIDGRDGAGLAYVAMAAAMLGSARDANDAFRESTRADPRRVETQVEWARLFLDHYDAGHAAESLAQALGVNPHHPVANALMARVRLAQTMDFARAQQDLDRALEANPNLVIAHVTRAGIAIREMDLAAADSHVSRALTVDPLDLEALSVRAALRFLDGDDAEMRRAVDAVLAVHPSYARLYSVIADYADWEHRYPQIVELARQGLRLDPEDATAHATLGINLLRMGEETEGLSALREAWRRDRFNPRVYNMLNLFDDVIAREYTTVDAGPLVLRLHREERDVLAADATAILRGAWDEMRGRYGFTPEHPVHIEMFSDREHFSVRTSGLPRMGVQGVCFGRVITALSPRAGPFNWAQIVWHELAHVFHIQLSGNRVPRWFTEGLAEYETILARPEWRREEDHRLHRALQSGRIPPLRRLNHAFTHARSGDEMTLAYYVSSMLVKYIGETHGFDALVRMLRGWGQGQSSAEVIESALGVDIDALDQAFRTHTERRLAGRANDFGIDLSAFDDAEAARRAAEASPQSADALARLAATELAQGQVQEGSLTVRRALRVRADHPLARYVAARLALARGDHATALADLRRLFQSGRDGYEPRLDQARTAMRLGRGALARLALERATEIDPERHEAWQGLLRIARAQRDDELRSRALRALVDLDQHNRAAHFDHLRWLREQRSWTALRSYGERTALLDPFNAEARLLYAEALIEERAHAAALTAVDRALAAGPEAPGPAHLLRARALSSLGRRRDARAAAEAAIAADPSLRAAANTLLDAE